MNNREKPSNEEMMIITAAKEIHDCQTVIAGAGLPFISTLLAQKSHAPSMILMFESGIINTKPMTLPKLVADLSLIEQAKAIIPSARFFGLLNSGDIDMGLLGAAQIDKYGNINTTSIGDPYFPKIRLAGSGGSNDIGSLVKHVVVIVPHELRRLPKKVDYITTPGYVSQCKNRKRFGLPPYSLVVITSYGIMRINESSGELYLASYYYGVKVKDIEKNTGWKLKISEDVFEMEKTPQRDTQLLRNIRSSG